MKVHLYFINLVFLCLSASALSQVTLTEASPVVTVNFATPIQATVGTGTYNGTGFSTTAITGRLNSAAWETRGWQNGNLLFGASMSNPAHGRGSVNGGVVTEGIYAYTDNPSSVTNPAMLIQAADNDFASGTLALKIKNNGTTNMTQLEISYNLFVRNDQDRAHSFNFSHSADNVVYEPVGALDYTTPDVLDNFQWVGVDVAPSRSTIISGINIAPGGVYYIRWSSEEATGSGDWDEIGLDDIMVKGTYGPPAPEINIIGSSALTIVNNDLTPTVSDGTSFANTYLGGSASIVTFTIQNLGGAPLNISNVIISGVNPGDFTIVGAVPNGTIPAVTSVIGLMELTIKFSPGAAGIRSALIDVISTDANESPYRFKVQGLGVIPQPDMEVMGFIAPNTSPVFSTNMIPSAFNSTLFPSQTVGGAGVVRAYKIKNTGTASQLILTAPSPYIQIAGNNPGDFILETIPTGNTMNAGFTKTFSIRFIPTAPGIRSAIVTIPNNDIIPDFFGNTEGPYTFLIQGVGISPEIDISGNLQPIISGNTTPTLVNHTFFDYLNITSGTLDRTYTIYNNGTEPLTLGTISISGSSEFTVITAPASSIAPAASSTFVIRYDPSLVGVANATVSIPTNDANENPYTFAIRGYGVNYIPCTFGVVETIALQDFEATPAAPVWAFSTAGTVTSVGGAAYAIVGDGGLTNRFLGARSLQVVNNAASVTMLAKNTTQYEDIELTVALSSLSLTLAEGTDLADKIVVAVSTDGGTTWSNELQVSGSTNSKWSFTSGTAIASTIYDGNNLATAFAPSATGFVTTDGYGMLTVSGLPKATSLQIRITLNNNNANELWAIDNVSLFGRKEIATIWNGSAWSNGVPNPAIKAVINGNYNTSTGNINACKCEVLAGRTVTINTNQFLDIQSDVLNYGQITIENGGSLVQHDDFATNVGPVTVKRHTTPMKKYDFTYWSTPVLGQTLTALSPLTLADKYLHFNTVANSWQSVAGATAMVPGKGYIIRAPENFTTTPQIYTGGQFIGVPNNGVVLSPVFVAASSWNLIGNPYPSAIDADLFLGYGPNVGKVGGTIYFWTHNTSIVNGNYSSNDYAVYNLLGGVGTAATSTGVNTTVPTGTIASGQGFFINAVAAGNATFTNSMRTSGGNMEFFRSAELRETSMPETEIERHRIWLNMTNTAGAFKQTLVGYATNATNGDDRDFDGTVLAGGNSVSLYSYPGTSLAIQGRALPFSSEDRVVLGYVAPAPGTFSISVDNKDGIFTTQSIFLEDKLLNIIHDLTAPYNFSTEAGTFNGRFELRYNDNALSSNDITGDVSNVKVAVSNNTLHVKSVGQDISSITVYDLLGRKVFGADDVSAATFSATNIIIANQALLVKILLEDGTLVTKKIVY